MAADYKRLDTLVKLAKKKEDEAAIELKKSTDAIVEENQRYEELKNYHDEYQQRIYDLKEGHTTVNDLQTYYAFMHQLNNVLMAQAQQIKLVEHQAEHIKKYWIECRSKLDGIKKLQEIRKNTHEAHLEKIEQKVIDDLVLSIYNRKF